MQVIKYMFQPHGDDRGQLVALEEFKDIPFRIMIHLMESLGGFMRTNAYSKF